MDITNTHIMNIASCLRDLVMLTQAGLGLCSECHNEGDSLHTRHKMEGRTRQRATY